MKGVLTVEVKQNGAIYEERGLGINCDCACAQIGCMQLICPPLDVGCSSCS